MLPLVIPALPDTMFVIATRDKNRVDHMLIPVVAFTVNEDREVSVVPLTMPELKEGTFRAAVLWQDGRVYESRAHGGRIFDSVNEWKDTIRVALGIRVDMTQDPPANLAPEEPAAPHEPPLPPAGPTIGTTAEGDAKAAELAKTADDPAAKPARQRRNRKAATPAAEQRVADTPLPDDMEGLV